MQCLSSFEPYSRWVPLRTKLCLLPKTSGVEVVPCQLTRAYAIVISVIWTLAIVASAMYFILANLISVIAAYYLSAVLFSIFLFIICVCNFCIWRKCKMRTISSHQQNRTAQNQRLTRTLLFVSAAAVMAWFPYVIVEYLLNVHNIVPAWQVYYTTIFLQYSNSFANPIIYAFKIPEFRQSSIMWRLTRRAINGVDTKNKKRTNRYCCF